MCSTSVPVYIHTNGNDDNPVDAFSASNRKIYIKFMYSVQKIVLVYACQMPVREM